MGNDKETHGENRENTTKLVINIRNKPEIALCEADKNAPISFNHKNSFSYFYSQPRLQLIFSLKEEVKINFFLLCWDKVLYLQKTNKNKI